MKHEISEAEMEIMKILWRQGEEATSAQLQRQCSDWKITTVLTLCKRLEDKGFLKRRKEGKTNYYRPTLTEEEYKAYQTQNFLEEVHSGSVKSFMAALYNHEALTQEDLEELKAWLKNV